MEPVVEAERVTWIDVGQDFARILTRRSRNDGEFSGEAFREDILEPALLINDKVVLNIDAIEHYSMAWMDEAISGVSRKYGVDFARGKIFFSTSKKFYLLPVLEQLLQVAGGHVI